MRRHAVVANKPLSQDKKVAEATRRREAHLERCQAPKSPCISANTTRLPGCLDLKPLSLSSHFPMNCDDGQRRAKRSTRSLLHCHNVAGLGMRHSLEPRHHSEHHARLQVCLTSKCHFFMLSTDFNHRYRLLNTSEAYLKEHILTTSRSDPRPLLFTGSLTPVSRFAPASFALLH